MNRLLRDVAICALAAGCALANLTPQARFAECANELNDSTRWGQVDAATRQVSPRYLEKFKTRHRDWGEAVSIADFDIVKMQVAQDRKGAVSEVAVSWYPTNGIDLRQTTIVQRWETDHGKFRLVDEAVQKGDARVFGEDEQSAGGGS